MNTFIVVLSLLFNFLGFFAILILYLRQNRLFDVEKKQQKIISEMEDIISSYLIQMKEENEDFINRMKKADKQQCSSIDNHGEKINNEPMTPANLPAVKSLESRIGKISAHTAVKIYQKNKKAAEEHDSKHLENDIAEMIPIGKDVNEDLRQNLPDRKRELISSERVLQEQAYLNEIVHLKNQGLDENEIAKKLNKGKTEIELLLKIGKNQT